MIRVLIAEGHTVFREHLQELCSQCHDLVVVAQTSSLQEMLEQMPQAMPDVVIMSLTMPTRSAFEALRELKRRHPAVPAIVLSLYHHDEYALHALDAGASGFLMMEQAQEQLVETVRMFVLGGTIPHAQSAAI
jgi:DNA-binding NarL/FixJ family response regulator